MRGEEGQGEALAGVRKERKIPDSVGRIPGVP
jgi:hypothetical protein